MKKLLILFLALISFRNASSQEACNLQISLLTCAPGEELYSTFGHSAMRVRDSVQGIDVIYNYGTFDFSPEFYSEFIRGKLLYYLSVESYSDFEASYRWQQRSIQEQVLQLGCDEKRKLHEALQINALEANKYYRYDFLLDNCSTRLRDMLSKGTGKEVVFQNILGEEKPTYRNLIHTYLDRGGQYWSRLGIDMLLGSKMDNRSTHLQSMFLPDYLLLGYDNAFIDGKKVAAPAQTILEIESPLNKGSWFRPSVVFSLLLLAMILLAFSKNRIAQKFLRGLDKLVFVLAGLAGFLMLFMWFGTDHELCSSNYNLIWALPTHAVLGWMIHKRSPLVRGYFSISFVITAAFLLFWLLLPQQINTALLPLLLILAWRSFNFSNFRDYVFRKNSHPQQ